METERLALTAFWQELRVKLPLIYKRGLPTHSEASLGPLF
jgi:hypothetical protein